MYYDNNFEVKPVMKQFYSVHVLEKGKNHTVLDLGYVAFETKKEMQSYIDRVTQENAYVFFNVQKIKLKRGRVKAF